MSTAAAPPEQDYVFREVAGALARPNRVIPILVGGARMPTEGDLPPGLRGLARRNAIVLDDDRWDEDVAHLLAILAGMRPKRPLARSGAGRPLGDRIRDAAHAGMQAAQGALALARALIAFHTWPGAVAAGLLVGLIMSLILWRLLPYALVPAAPDVGRSFATWSANGRWLAVRNASGETVLVDAAAPTAAPIVLRAASSMATAAAFAPDGSSLHVGYEDGSGLTYSVPLGEAKALTTAVGAGAVLALATRRDGSVIVLRPSQLDGAPVKFEEPIVAGSFSANADAVATAAVDGSVQVLGLPSAAPNIVRYACGRGAVPTLSPNASWLACVDGKGVATLWNVDAATQGTARTADLPGAADVTSVAFTPDSRVLAIVRSTRAVDFVDVASQRVVASTALGGERARAAAFSPTSDTFVAAGAVDVEFIPVTGTKQAQIPPVVPPAERELVPSLLKMTPRAAQSALDRYSLVVGNVQTRASSAPKDTIIAQEPKSGASAAKGSAVNVTVSDGALVRIPNVVGLPADAAEKTLFAARLTAAPDSRGSPSVNVVRQEPPAGAEVAANTSVRLTLAAPPQLNAPVQQSAPQQNVPASSGWCCVKQSVVSMSGAECEKSGGRFASMLEAARAICGQSPPAQAK